MKSTIDNIKNRFSQDTPDLMVSDKYENSDNKFSEISYSMISHMGKVRNNNEDSCTATKFHFFFEGKEHTFLVFGVADGMGGLESGEKASYTAINEVISYIGNDLALSATTKNKEALLEFALKRANDKIMEINDGLVAEKVMGTTMIIAMVQGSILYFAHAGDSTIFSYMDKKLTQVNHTHRLKNSNALFSCLGLGKDLKIETGRFDMSKNNAFLMCSDGLTDMVNNIQIKKILSLNYDKPKKIVDELLAEALKNGGIDNISIIYGYHS